MCGPGGSYYSFLGLMLYIFRYRVHVKTVEPGFEVSLGKFNAKPDMATYFPLG